MSPNLSHPWYREPWPWILMAGPFLVIVAGIVTTVLAVATSDGLVADDYYKQGLAINRVIARDARARALGAWASLQFDDERTHARVMLAPSVAPPDSLTLTLVHPTRAGEDQSVVLRETTSPAVYEGALAAPRRGTWHLRLTDARRTWRLTGEWQTHQGRVSLEPAGP